MGIHSECPFLVGDVDGDVRSLLSDEKSILPKECQFQNERKHPARQNPRRAIRGWLNWLRLIPTMFIGEL